GGEGAAQGLGRGVRPRAREHLRRARGGEARRQRDRAAAGAVRRAGLKRPRIALVLAGGGARGAYEVGALSVLLPELERRGERPRILVGTSIGALNAAFLAAAADRPATETVDEGRQVWLETGFRDVAAPVLSGRSAWRFARAGATLLSPHGVSLRSVLDPAP